jgi:hypothetical protein
LRQTHLVELIEVAIYESLAECRQRRLRDMYIFLRCSEARADGSDYLAIHYHRDSTLTSGCRLMAASRSAWNA